jgi:hypothetical protein
LNALQAQHPGAADQERQHARQWQADAAAHAHGLEDRAQTQNAPAKEQTLVQAQVAGAAFAHVRVELLGTGDLFRGGPRAHRHVALLLAVADHRCGVGAHPVVVAVLAPVLYQRGPGFTAFERGPHVGKGFPGHVRVAHQVVRLALDLLQAKAAHGDERGVGVGDVALRVRGGHQGGVVGECVLALSDGGVDAHGGLGFVGEMSPGVFGALTADLCRETRTPDLNQKSLK